MATDVRDFATLDGVVKVLKVPGSMISIYTRFQSGMYMYNCIYVIISFFVWNT